VDRNRAKCRYSKN